MALAAFPEAANLLNSEERTVVKASIAGYKSDKKRLISSYARRIEK